MNRRGLWRELWLVLTLLAICTFFASVFPVLFTLSQDPYALMSTVTDLGWLLSGWPPRPPSAAQVLAVLPFLSGLLAWRFHRFYQNTLQPLAEEPAEEAPPRTPLLPP